MYEYQAIQPLYRLYSAVPKHLPNATISAVIISTGFCPDVTWNPGRLKLPSSPSPPKEIIVPDTITWKKRTRSALVHLVFSRCHVEKKSQVQGQCVCHPEDLFKFVVSKDNSSVECAHDASPSYIRIHNKAQMSLAESPV